MHTLVTVFILLVPYHTDVTVSSDPAVSLCPPVLPIVLSQFPPLHLMFTPLFFTLLMLSYHPICGASSVSLVFFVFLCQFNKI